MAARGADEVTLVLYSDADNTLWETDAVYRRAHLSLFKDVVERMKVQPAVSDPVAFVRVIDQELARWHPDHLGYPPSLLVAELVKRLTPAATKPLPESLVVEIEAEFTKLTGELPALRAGVARGLSHLQQLGYPVHVMTEGGIERCVSRLRHHRISDYVQSVEKVVKSTEQFERLRGGLAANVTGWVVGDLLTRDILPARAAGFRTIYFPGSFVPRWEKSVAIDPDIIQIDTFATVPEILEKAEAKGA